MTRCAPFALFLICAASLAAAQTPSFKPLAVQPTHAAPAAQPAPAGQAAPAAAHPSFRPLATQPTRPASGAAAVPARPAAPVPARPAPAPAPSRPVASPPARMVAPAPAVAAPPPAVAPVVAQPAPSIYDVPSQPAPAPAPAPARAAQPAPRRAAAPATKPSSTPGTRVVLDPEWPANELERGRPVSRGGRPPLFSGGVPESWQMHEWRLSGGAFLHIDGKVKETFRSLYAAMGEDYKQALAESYNLDDFGVDPPYWTLGLAFERQWRVFAFRWDLHYLAFSTHATAVRDYYMGLFGDEINYQGRKYDHVMIPKGRKFSADFNGVLTDFILSITPFTLAVNERVRLAPFVEVGAVLIGGNFKLDAGETTGTTVYQNPPVNFAVGGHSSSFLGIGAPMGGVGAKLEVGDEYATRWFLAGRLDAFSYKGSSKLFTSSSHRDKKLDVTFLDISAETGIVRPWRDKEFICGVRYQVLDLSGSIKGKASGKEAIIAARERFDKDVDFSTSVLTVFGGIRF